MGEDVERNGDHVVTDLRRRKLSGNSLLELKGLGITMKMLAL